MRLKLMFLYLQERTGSRCLEHKLGILEFEGDSGVYNRLRGGESIAIGDYKIRPYKVEEPSTLLVEAPLSIIDGCLTMKVP